MQADDKDLQTPEQREAAMERLARAVFDQFAEKAIDKPSHTFDNLSLRDFAKRGIDEYRQVEAFLLENAKEVDFSNS